MKHARHIAAMALVLFAGTGCSRIGAIADGPSLSPVSDPSGIAQARTVSMPMPEPAPQTRNASSLWQKGSTSFFRDQRAAREGDILTVLVDIKDGARLKNETKRGRSASEAIAAPQALGLESKLGGVIDLDSGIELTSGSSTSGSGSVNRNENINLRVAAVVTRRLPNGNLVISGRQEIRVNSELRELVVAGVIRPEDISAQNTVTYDQIAEARISYGGRGTISDVQRPRYGQEVADIVLPW